MGRALSLRDGFLLVGDAQIDSNCVPGKQGLPASFAPDEEKLVLGAFDLVAELFVQSHSCRMLVQPLLSELVERGCFEFFAVSAVADCRWSR